MKAPALRKELESRGLDTSGKKAALLERLAACVEQEHESIGEAEKAPTFKPMKYRLLKEMSMDTQNSMKSVDFRVSKDHEQDMEGWLEMQLDDLSWERRYVTLDGRRMVIYSDEEASTVKNFLCKVPLNLCLLSTGLNRDDRPHAWSITVTNTKQMVGEVREIMMLDSGDQESRDTWVDALSAATTHSRATKIREEFLKSLFHELDRDGNGGLDRDEIGKLADKIGMKMDLSQLTVLFMHIDTNRSGLVDWDEFLAWYHSKVDETDGPTDEGRLKRKLVNKVSGAVEETSEWLLFLFQKYDTDGNGGLDKEEMGMVCADIGLKLTDKELDAAFKEIDDNDNGEIDFQELQEWHENASKATSKATSKLRSRLMRKKSTDEKLNSERDKLKLLFDKIDSDGNGYVDRDEFRLLLAELGLFYDIDELENSFNEIDVDGNEGIDYEEFLGFYEGRKDTNSNVSKRIQTRMRVIFRKRNSKDAGSESQDDMLGISEQGLQQIQGTQRTEAKDMTYEFSTISGSYSVLHSFGLKALPDKEKQGFTAVDKLVYLHQTKLFENMEITEVLRIAQVCEQINMRTGDVLFDDGDDAYCAYFVMAGELSLFVSGVTVPLKSRDKPFGEIALLYNRPRSGKCVAAQNTVLLCLFRADLQLLFAKQHVSEPDFMRALSVLIVNSLRGTYQQLEKKQSTGSVGSSLALEVARAGWGYDASDFMYVGKARPASGMARSRRRQHDLERHVEKIAKQKHLDAAVMAPEAYSTIEKIILLKSCKLFETASDKSLARVAEIVRTIRVPVGVTLYQEGQGGQDAFIIATGQIKLMRNGGMIGLRERGTINGATALVVPGDPRSATAVTTKETVIMNISSEALEGIMEEQEELRIGMMKILSDRLFDSYGRLNVITKVDQRQDYFTVFQRELRLDVRNLRRFQETEWSNWSDSDTDEDDSSEVDRSLSRFKRSGAL
jgi:Ca2+-binding EF-hand superfamily protein/CRP-like cAMP-binding protein